MSRAATGSVRGEVIFTAPVITSEYVTVALLAASAASVAVRLTGYVPAVAGVPETVPVVVFSVSPAGSDPDVTDQLKDPLPPAACPVAL